MYVLPLLHLYEFRRLFYFSTFNLFHFDWCNNSPLIYIVCKTYFLKLIKIFLEPGLQTWL
jgi:hypothetical protein